MVGDLVMFGTTSLIADQKQNTDINHSIMVLNLPIIWEVIDITNGSDRNHRNVKLVQVLNQLNSYVIEVLKDQNRWSGHSLRKALNESFEKYNENHTKDAISINVYSEQGDDGYFYTFDNKYNFNKYESNLIIPRNNDSDLYKVSCSYKDEKTECEDPKLSENST